MIDILDIEAEERAKLHANHMSSRPLSDGYELVGLVGEAEFSRVFQVPMDLTRKPNGDGRVDFVIPLRYTVDVKCARIPNHLIEEQGKVRCDIYVLSRYLEATRNAELLGWEWGSILARAPVRDFGHGILNHYIPREALKPMFSLLDRVMRLV